MVDFGTVFQGATQLGSALLGYKTSQDAGEIVQQAADAGRVISKEAIEQGRQDILSTAEPSLDDIVAGIQGGVSSLETQGGAEQIEQALSGALGPEAQQAALNDFSLSPGQKFLQDEQEQALLRNSAAIGGLGGGNVRADLQQTAADRSNLFLQQHIENLRSLRGSDQQRSANIANTLTGGGSELARFRSGIGSNLANITLGGAAQQLPLVTGAGAASAAAEIGSTSAIQQGLSGLSQTLGSL